MDPRKKQLLIGIGMIAIALVGGFLVVQAIRMYTPKGFQANVNQVENNSENTISSNNTGEQTNPLPIENILITGINTDILDQVTAIGEVTVIIPARVDTSEFKELIGKIENSYGVTTKIRKINTISEYQIILRAVLQHPEQADIVLVPTNRIDSFTNRGYFIPFKNSIAPLFHPLFHLWISHKDFTYIPFVLDPYVTFYNPSTYTPQGKTTFSDIQSALLTPRKTTTGYLPLLFGIDAGDLALLEQGISPYPGYVELLQLFLNMDITMQSLTLLEFFDKTSYRDTTRFHTLSTTLGERVNSCQHRPQLCLLAYDISDIGFGRLHELAYLKDGFPNARAQIEFSNIPTLEGTYPVTGWGRVISKKSSNIPASLTWLKGYLQIIVDEEPQLNEFTLSATNILYQRQKIENRYLPLAQFSTQYKFVVGSITDSQKLIQKTSLLPMLRGEYSKGIFLKSMTEATK